MKIAFTSCNHPKVHPSQPGWLALARVQPDVLLLLGDNVYIEDRKTEVLVPALRPALRLTDAAFAQRLHARYRQQYAVTQFRDALAASRLVLGTLDDHDFLGNDLYVSPATQGKARLARVLHRQFLQACNTKPLLKRYPDLPDWREGLAPNGIDDPSWDSGLGVASSHSAADVKLIVLDNRSFREKPAAKSARDEERNQHRVALGAAQMNWLMQELVGSQSVSIIASGSPLTRGTKPLIPGSALADYPHEALQLRSLYAAQAHQVVLHLCGDLHYNQLHPADASHPGFTELASSGMGSGWEPFAKKPNGNWGLVEVQATQVRLQTFGNDAQRNYDITLPRNLTNKM